MAELHYRLTHQEWCRLYKLLTDSEKGVLLYLRTLDPFGDNYRDLKTSEVAEGLGISQRSVQRALLKLSDLKLIDFQLSQFQFRIKSRYQCHEATFQLPSDPDDASRSACRQNDTSDTAMTPVTVKRHEDRDRTPESAQAKASTTSHTDQTDQSGLNLSLRSLESEEGLIEFVGNQNSNARNQRAYAIKCLSHDRGYWEERYQQYQQAKDRANIPLPVMELNFSANQLISSSEDTRETHVSRLRAKWLMPNLRHKIQQEIAAHPEWGVAIVNGEVVQVQQLAEVRP